MSTMNTPGAKRQRLTNACTQCRKRKVRCDEGLPTCKNCRERNEQCITTDPRNQATVAIRRRTENKVSSLASVGKVPILFEERYNEGLEPCNSDFGSHVDQKQVDSKHVTCGNHQHTTAHDSLFASRAATDLPWSNSTFPTSISANFSSVRHENETILDQGPFDQEMIMNTGPHSKRKFIGGGTLQALSKHLDYFFEKNGFMKIGTKFVHGMQHAEEFPLPNLGCSMKLPALPPLAQRRVYLESFLDRIHPLFPILNMEAFARDIEILANRKLTALKRDEVPSLACAYALFALTTDESAGFYTEAGWEYLEAAFNLMTYLVSVPYLTSVQALLLLTIALRARNKDGCGGYCLSQAIRIAQSLGLHRNVVQIMTNGKESTLSYNEDVKLDSRIWCVCYCLEQAYGLEIGRPTSIRDIDYEKMAPLMEPPDNTSFLGIWVGLARIQNRLYSVLYERSPGTESASHLLSDIGRIDRELCDWASKVEPEEIRPSLDLLCSFREMHLATFISTNYFHTLITVHQAALLLDPRTYKAQVEIHCFADPSRPRLQSSEIILINSARKIADLHIRLIDQKTRSGIFTLTSSMLALMILGFHIMKGSELNRNRADLELLTILCRDAETRYAESGQDPRFVEAIPILQSQIQQEVQSRAVTIEMVPPPRNNTQNGYFDTKQHSDSAQLHDSWSDGAAGYIEDWSMNFGDFALADPWRWLQLDNNSETDNRSAY